jgi:hypothetical protein
MQSIGITVEEIAIIYLALPFTTFLAPPITGFLVDKFGKYKPVMILTLVLNAIFHHALFMIPQQEIPGTVPNAYVMRNPKNGNIDVWWSPCPSRECPEETELDFELENCVAHCLLDTGYYSSTSMESLTSEEPRLSSIKEKLEERQEFDAFISSSTMISLITQEEFLTSSFSSSYESWVTRKNESVRFKLNMHPDLGDPKEQLGIEIEESSDDNHTHFKQRFGEKVLTENGVNVTELEELDIRCGGLVVKHNITINDETMKVLAEKCMVQECVFKSGGPEICPPDYKDSDDKVFWIYFLLRFLGTIMLSGGVTM